MKYLLSLPMAIVIAAVACIIFLELDGLDGSGIAILAAGAFFMLALKIKIAIDRLFKSKQNK